MKSTLTALALVAGTALGLPAQAQDQKNLVTILTAEDAQRQLMAMVLTINTVQAGATALILLCGSAGDLAMKDAPASATEAQVPMGMSPQGLMQTIMKKTGTKVEVCAICLPNKGVGEDALLDGITAARPPVVAGALIADNTVVMSF
ncbi:MAG: hypothetical protein ACU0B7_08405 [Paracoccaceae bacterium]|uniref:hypothetical protein n=1 Tax=Seohaeicola saemankumensis TaxID=481181 RepID=UPI001E3BD250|nr:hypothetical protein [Seohaeicola saemankumensis]